MCSSIDLHTPRPAGKRKGDENGLQHQRRAACATAFAHGCHIETISACLNRLRGCELHGLRVELITCDRRAANRGHRAYCGQMLRSKSGSPAPGTNILDAHGPPGNGRKTQGRSQDLATTLAMGTVYNQPASMTTLRRQSSCDLRFGFAQNGSARPGLGESVVAVVRYRLVGPGYQVATGPQCILELRCNAHLR